MMAFATSTLVNGEWTTRTLDVDAVLKHYNQKDKDSSGTYPLQHEIAPTLGVLSQTVTPSSLVHWILAARLRDLETQDVVFIGDDFVQVKELQADGSLQDIIRKDNFGSRIRNARIVGSIKDFEEDPEAQINSTQFKDEENDFYMDLSAVSQQTKKPVRWILPPQVILLQFTSGDLVFLMLRQSDSGSLEFVSNRRRVSKAMLKLQPGMHLAVDPSSRYTALGCSEGVVAIYALHSRNELKAQYFVNSNIQYVASSIRLFLSGAILKVEFLHPSPDDDKHIILLVLVAAKGKTRMLVFEWEAGSKLSDIRPHSTKGHLLDKNRQLPLLLIPLTIKSSFILVCENSMSVCLGILHGAPSFIDFNDTVDPPTEFHNGRGYPLWTSWTRALRFPHRTSLIDDIFVVREDGLIKLLELDSTLDEVVKSDNNIGEFGVSCGTALACLYVELGDFTKSGDMFVIGGDSCAGGTYLLPARRNPALLEPIPNWSPAHDFVTTHPPQSLDASLDASLDGKNYHSNKNSMPKPDRVFACVGKGLNGAVVEFRQGLEAKIGLETNIDTPVMESWVFSGLISGIDGDQEASLFLLSLGDSSKVLRLTNNPAEIEELDETQTKFDLRYRTIAASAIHENNFFQVTEKSITIGSGSVIRRLEGAELLSVPQEFLADLEPRIYSAVIIDRTSIAFTTNSNNLVYLQLVQTKDTESAMEGVLASSKSKLRMLSQYLSHITCLATCTVDDGKYVIVAQWEAESITLDFQPLESGNVSTFTIPTSGIFSNGLKLEAIASIAAQSSKPRIVRMLCGTRNGILIALELDVMTKEIIASHADRIGATSVTICEDQHSIYGFFAICDSKLFALRPKSWRRTSKNWARNFEICRFWLTDALRPGMEQPRLTSIASQPPSQLITSTIDLLVTAGSQIIVVSLSPEIRAIPRHIRIGGTPSRLLYSQSLEALVVAASVRGKSTLIFIDPETGANLSQPVDQKTKEPVEFIAGLGNPNERVFRLFEWAYTKDGKTWNFIILSTNTGRLMIVSIDNQERIRKDIQNALFKGNAIGNESGRSKISYYTRYKFKTHQPVYSVTGYSDGLIWCSGENLYCDALDLTAKKFKRIAEYILPSPAINLRHDSGTISALTLNHSLEILQLILNEAGETEIVRSHGDQVTRPSLHHIIYSQSSSRPIHLVSDKNSSLVGLWPIQNTKADTLETIFEAPLPSSVLRFCFASCRPYWDSAWTTKQLSKDSGGALQLENVSGLSSHSELLGLSITGVLSHFTILDLQAWKFLRYLMDLAIRSTKACEYSYRSDPVPVQTLSFPKTMMHVDGDILRRCLREGLLEYLLCVSEDKIKVPEVFARFCELLQDLHQGTLAGDRSPSFYIDQAYVDLEFFLRPILQ